MSLPQGLFPCSFQGTAGEKLANQSDGVFWGLWDDKH